MRIFALEYTFFQSLFKKAFQINQLPTPTEEQIERFYHFCDFLLETNKITNLTAIRTEEDVIYKHFVDSAMVSAYIPPKATVLDLGCGPGFPSLPLAILRPDITIKALDSTSKKITFLNQAAELLGLKNINGIAGRAEDAAIRKELGQFTVVVSRAVARLNVLCELCIPYLQMNGQLLAMKGSKAEEELMEAEKAIQTLGGNSPKQISLTLITETTQEFRAIIQTTKIAQTPPKYPRPYASILKKPL